MTHLPQTTAAPQGQSGLNGPAAPEMACMGKKKCCKKYKKGKRCKSCPEKA